MLFKEVKICEHAAAVAAAAADTAKGHEQLMKMLL